MILLGACKYYLDLRLRLSFSDMGRDAMGTEMGAEMGDVEMIVAVNISASNETDLPVEIGGDLYILRYISKWVSYGYITLSDSLLKFHRRCIALTFFIFSLLCLHIFLHT